MSDAIGFADSASVEAWEMSVWRGDRALKQESAALPV